MLWETPAGTWMTSRDVRIMTGATVATADGLPTPPADQNIDSFAHLWAQTVIGESIGDAVSAFAGCTAQLIEALCAPTFATEGGYAAGAALVRAAGPGTDVLGRSVTLLTDQFLSEL